MTNYEKKKYLSRYIKLDKRIDLLCEEKTQVLSKALKISPEISDMPKGGSGENQLQSAVERMLEIEDEINVCIDELVFERKCIESCIETLENETLQILMRYRYLLGWTFEKIAVEMNYSYMHVTRLHGKALEKIKML